MTIKVDKLERTILELGTEIYRVRHKLEVMESENHYLRDAFLSLRNLFDEKGIIAIEEFDEAVAIDRILAKQAHSQADLPFQAEDLLKKIAN